MRFKTITSPHARKGNQVNNVMLDVLIALIPGALALTWFFGWGIIINILIAGAAALLVEAIFLMLRRRPVISTLKDNSALVTACLLALAIPPLSPWWLTFTGILFAIVFAKQLYGGLGYNPFNPAMVGYVVLLIAFPLEMTQWLAANNSLSFTDSLHVILFGPASVGGWDAITGATPLDTVKTELALMKPLADIQSQTLFGMVGGKGWETVALLFFIGGGYLLYKRVITWHTPVAMLLSLFVISGIFYLVDSSQYTSPLFHLFSGGAMLGAFFIATDPVSSCTSNKGKLVYGAGIGILTYIIRSWGGYPDGVAFAVLLMNMTAPFIDYYTKPRVFGQTP